VYKVWQNGKIIESEIPGRFAGIVTMRIFGRLTCKNGMRAKKKNRIFFLIWEDAISAGYRPCKLCRPSEGDEYSRSPEEKRQPRRTIS